MDIKFEKTPEGGRYEVPFDGIRNAEMTYQKIGENHFALNHTFVPEEKRGEGIGEAMAERAVADARDKGFTLRPDCPFFAAQAKDHDWNDVVKA